MSHILVLRFSSMGDVAMIVPVLRCLVKNYPDLEITLVTKEIYGPIFREFKNIKFHYVDFKKQHKGIKGLWRLFKELKRLRPTHVADLHGVIRTYFLSWLFIINLFKTKRVDKQRSKRKKLFRKKNKILQPLTPIQFKYCEVFNKLGFNIELTNHEFIDPFVINDETQQIIYGTKNNLNWVGIAPFASFNGKTYPLDLMQQLIAFLQRDHQVFLFGNGEFEISKLEIWEKAYQNVFGAYKLGSLNNELEIISNLDIMISMDSANGHLAANYNVPVIVLWGLTHPFGGFAPFASNPENMIVSDRSMFPKIPTSAYGKKIPKGYENVMRTISYKDVAERCLKILESSKRHQNL
ncbi:MAG: ADP-heptose--LPS heptosyltransferase RfaF [Flavobacteriaceae bacterium]|nr:ADP-heptose--LPS heptosyltransferase RfaF [Flavobacteriaceae bacterium]|tara:strand:- start:18555 stop:19607 length:1053 start_codon:yes stop_codon:yes gene_type:complete